MSRSRELETAERRAFVVQCRRMGATYADIAQAVIEQFGERTPKGYCDRHAHQDLTRELARTRKEMSSTLEDLREIELQRLEEMHSRLYPVALGTEHVPPDVFATDRVLKIMDRRAALTGMNAPQKMIVEDAALTDEERARRIAEILDNARHREGAALPDAAGEGGAGPAAAGADEGDCAG